MFVRWKRRPARRRHEPSPPGEQILYAVLVESRRVDGQPRQHVVRYLGAIGEGQIGYPLSADRFWRRVEAALAEQGLSAEQLQALASRIAAVVPRPNPALVQQQQRELAIRLAGLGSMITGLADRRRYRHRRPAAYPSPSPASGSP